MSFQLQEGPGVFSPKDLVELGRPGTGIANEPGDLVLVPFSQYSFNDKKNRKSVFIAALDSTAQPLEIPLEKGGETFWLDRRTLGHVVSEDDDKSLAFYAIDLHVDTTDAFHISAPQPPTRLGSFPGSTASNFRYVAPAKTLVFSAYVHPDGDLSAVPEHDTAWGNRGTSALVYDHTFMRHWDHWVGPTTASLFSVPLYREADGKWTFIEQFTNLLQGTGHSSPVEPFGGTDDFDVSATQLVYTAKHPVLPEAWHTRQNIYIVDFTAPGTPRELTSGKQGATHSPVFNTEGSKVAWLELDEDGYESDRFKIVVYDLRKSVRYTLTQKWDRSPDSLAFSKNDQLLYLSAGDRAKIKVFVLPVPETPAESTVDPALPVKYHTPVALTETGAVSAVQPLSGGRLLFSKSSLTSPNDVFLISGLKDLSEQIANADADSPLPTYHATQVRQVTHLTTESLRDKRFADGEEFYFEGAEGKSIQGWAVKPLGWALGETKKWPVVLLIHGGPQGAWEDQWSTRWNPNVFAQQGYFVIMFNPTGSTTFGQELTDAITEDWGGKPFVDIQKGWKYALSKYPEIDVDRAVAAGASWGGYAINWIQGHPEFGFNFKALVCHDGVFDSTYNGFSTDELFFFNHEWGGRPWEKTSKELAEKYNPSNYVHKWSTPQLLIHGSKDYRLPETEGIGAFNALQQRGVPSRLVIFPDENHWVLNHGNSLKWHWEVFRWFDQFIGNATKQKT
ncbi:alpha/beta-hydrolase [Fistulina hepatica ATCC 64428]|uniref:Dipeptidyl-peptidase V n=1 Tax=Fistulina hepatica ATCC 64428 TaxID=1128425 RepID=A0A0D7A3P7_9AGAR|nr:alpha/beta-hydrolase [Fistulina hepatica ATCC 64428]